MNVFRRLEHREGQIQALESLVSRIRPSCEVPRWVYDELVAIVSNKPPEIEVTKSDIFKVVDRTGVGFQLCKSVLEDVGGDIEKAVYEIRMKGAAIALRRIPTKLQPKSEQE